MIEEESVFQCGTDNHMQTIINCRPASDDIFIAMDTS